MEDYHFCSDDGEGYVIACQKIFSVLYKSKVLMTPYGSGNLKDLIIDSPKGTVYVKCMFWDKGNVTRSDVQRLRSEMSARGVEFGIIVTTYRFSTDAVRYVSDYGAQIELMEFDKLVRVSAKAGFNVIMDPPSAKDEGIPPVGRISSILLADSGRSKRTADDNLAHIIFL